VIGQAALPTPELVFEPLLPELALAVFAMAGLLYEAFAKRSEPLVHLSIGLVGVLLAGATTLWLWWWDGPATVLGDAIAADRFAVLSRLLLLVVAALGLLLGHQYFARSGDEQRGEFVPLVLFATSGMTLIVAAADLIVTFLALEILSLALYVLTGLTGRRAANEAAMKYFLLGAFSSAFFLYGVAMAYGATGTTKIGSMAIALTGSGRGQALAVLGLALLAVGFAFKVSAAPFHMWTPDVYQGAPSPVTAYMSAATKIAAFAALIRVLDVAFQALAWDWAPVVWALAAVSVVVGSILAIAQTNVKRMLAYSSIAHAGFILTGLTSAGSEGIRAAMFYLVAYAAMTIGAFGSVMIVSGRGEERTRIADYTGLARTNPVAAALMTLFLLSLAGIPPTAGFIAKVNVFSAAIDAGYWALALVGVLASVAAAFFYLRVIVLMYMQEPEGAPAPSMRVEVGSGAMNSDRNSAANTTATAAVLAIPAVATLLLGVFPGVIVGVIREAAVLTW
jgi:NADH-quinone oxidoreductase subunit N